MSDIDEIQRLIKEGFLPAMVLRAPSEDEIRRHLPNIHTKSQFRALPFRHPDGRKLMYYMKDPAAIKFAEKLVAEQNVIIGYDLCVYCSGVGPDTIHGSTLHLNNVVNELRKAFGWDVSISDYPHTFEVSFKIKGDDRQVLEDKINEVRKVALLLSLQNHLGFVVSSISSGECYQGQPFSLKWGLQERNVLSFTSPQLAYVKRIWADQNAYRAATTLQDLYCQVTDNSKIAIAWAAIEEIFGCPAKNLLNSDELQCLLRAVEGLTGIPEIKRGLLKRRFSNPDTLFSESRNERIARSISDMTGKSFDDVLKKVKALANERGRRLHSLSSHSGLLAKHIAFAENTLWAKIEKSVEGANPFSK